MLAVVNNGYYIYSLSFIVQMEEMFCNRYKHLTSQIVMLFLFCRFSAADDEEDSQPNLMRGTTMGNGW